MGRSDLEETSRFLARLVVQARTLADDVAGGRAEPGRALASAFRLERQARILGRRLRAWPDPSDPTAKSLLVAAGETAVLLTAAVRRLRAQVAVKDRAGRGE